MAIQVDRVEHRAHDRRVDVAQRAKALMRSGVLLVLNARTTKTVPSTSVEMIAESVTATSGGLSIMTRSKRSPSSAMNFRKRSSEACRPGWAASGRRGSTRDWRCPVGFATVVDRRLADEHVRDAAVTRAIEDAVEARAAQIAVDDADALPALGERDRDAARDRRLALRWRGARHEELSVTAGPGS